MIEELRAARWFGGKSRAIRDTRVIDRANWTANSALRLVVVEYESAPAETYVVADHLEQPAVARELLRCFRGATIRTECGGSLVFSPTHVYGSLTQRTLDPIRALTGEQSNTSIRFGDTLILKLFRRVQFGPNPDVEIGRYLTDETSFTGTPAVAGTLDYVDPRGAQASLALLQRFEPNRGDAWTTTLARVGAVLSGADLTESISAMSRLGTTTAKLHLALAAGADDFSSEPISQDDLRMWRMSLEDEVTATLQALARKDIAIDVAPLMDRANGINGLFGALKSRHHGDYHLGQVLERADGSFVIIDFEGEPSRPLAQRREKRSPLRDVAGMLRSFDYARHAGLRAGDAAEPRRVARGAEWYSAVREAFLTAYLHKAREHPRLLPDDVAAPLAALELEKAAYEVLYELNNRPDWLPIPLAAFLSA